MKEKMLSIFETLAIIYASIYSLVKGYGKEKLWSLALLGLYLITGSFLRIIGAAIYGPENYRQIYSNPISLIFGVMSAVLLIGSSIWIVNRIKMNRAVRIVEDEC